MGTDLSHPLTIVATMGVEQLERNGTGEPAMSNVARARDVATYQRLRVHHPAWRLLAARRAPLVLACLGRLFDQPGERVTFDDGAQLLAELLAEHANNPEYEIRSTELGRLARRELRDQIRNKLLVERDGELSPTDALQQVFRFLDRLEDRIMSSTASRLATVQHQIAEVAARLDPDPEVRATRIRGQIAELEAELAAVAAGDVAVLEGDSATEAIQDVYSLTMSLREDFGRVEDSYRRADQELRIAIVRDQQHRGLVVDRLLEGHDALVETPEGRVFQAFHVQLNASGELEQMSGNVARILASDAAQLALTRHQQADLRRIRGQLVAESSNVVRARARSERDVRNYLRSGLGLEHQRVTQLLDAIFEQALEVDWARSAVRRGPSPLPALGIPVAVQVPARLRTHEVDHDAATPLDFMAQPAVLGEFDNELRLALQGLDRHDLARRTVAVLHEHGRPLTLAELAEVLPPTHDLETVTVWIEMAGQVGAAVSERTETFDIAPTDGPELRFTVPVITLDPALATDQSWEL
jgi:hypothetical protein